MIHNFSNQTNLLIEKARQVALDLGYSYISTIHFLLADCELNGEYSIRAFVFKDRPAYTTFYDSQRCNIQDDTTVSWGDDLPLLKEAEHAIRNAHIEKRCYRDKFIQPYHIFLAAIKNKNSILFSIFNNKEGLAVRLENYYVTNGQIKKENIKNGFWYKLGKRGFLILNK